MGVMPEGSSVLTFGIDVQDNRLAISGWAWGRDEEAWLIYHQEIFGDPSRADLWKQVDEAVLREWDHASGRKLRPDVVAIDSGGHFTAEVYQFARERARQGVIAIKGASARNKPVIGRASKVDLNSKGRTLKRGAVVHSVGTDTAKTTLFARLKHNEAGEGYLHFPTETTDEFFNQLTAEKQVLKHTRGGFPVREWVKKPNARNEALDTLVYAYAGLNYLYQRRDRRTIWDQYERRLEEPLTSKKAVAAKAAASSFVQNW
jgi:phage terminase large subunit GpA-like protein